MNIAGLLIRAADWNHSGSALRWDDRSASYGELRDRVLHIAAGLGALGVLPGDRVVLLQRNGPTFVESLFGALAAGAVVVPLNARMNPREAAYIVDDAGASAILFDPEYSAGLTEALGTSSTVRISTAPLQGELDYETVVARHPRLEDCVHRAATDPAWLFYTSGTTGRPKGATLSHRNLRQMVLNHLADVQPFATGDRVLHAAPLSHGSGMVMLSAVARAATNVLYMERSFDPAAIAALIDRERISHVAFFAPTQVVKLLGAAELRKEQFTSLESICYGGAPMFVEDLKRALDFFGPVLAQIYGQGEAPMTIARMTRDEHARFATSNDPRLGSAGRARTDVEVRVVADDGSPRKDARQAGEIVVRGDVVMSGYWGKPEATAETLRDGWLYTGDIGYLDEHGYLFLQDRSKDLIISGGNNIYPREIEEALLLLPTVEAVAVIGVPDPYWGESVHAVIVPRRGTLLTKEQIIEHCKEHLSDYKKPRSIEFVTRLPTNAYGKVLKRDLRERHWSGFERRVAGGNTVTTGDD